MDETRTAPTRPPLRDDDPAFVFDVHTVPALVERAAERFGDIEGLVDGDLRLSFAELADAVDDAARGLIAAGIAAGDRIAVWAPNMAEWVIAALGAFRAGAVVVTVNTRFKGAEAAYIINTAGARMLLTVTDFLDTDYVALLAEVDRPASLEQIVVLRGPVPEGCTAWGDILARADETDPVRSAERAGAVTPDDICDVIFTSGTTGAPKGAMLRHDASLQAFNAWATVVGLVEGDRYLIINPFFHAFGLKAGIFACLMKGATILPHPVFDVPSVMQRVHDERITMLPGTPAIYQTILDHPDLASYDLSTLRLAVTGAATVPVEMVRRMRSELTFETIVTGYGLTESSGITTMCRHTDDIETIANTAGRPIPGVEVKVVDAEGEQTAVGEPGEVVVRGYNVMAGYFDDDAATAEAIRADGWLHTGDIGVLDQRGNLKITDRKKDMYIVGGFNAYPAEIENTLHTHPAIAQAAVIGIPDHRLGEVGKAYIVPRTTTTIDTTELTTWCRKNMANYKVPRTIEIVDTLPLNASGKVLKYILRERSIASES